MTQWLRGASRRQDFEVMGSNPGRVELGVLSTPVQVILEPKIMYFIRLCVCHSLLNVHHSLSS